MSNLSQQSVQYSIPNQNSDIEPDNIQLSTISTKACSMSSKHASTVTIDRQIQHHPIPTVVLDDSSDSDDELQTHTPIVNDRNVNIVLTSKTHKLHIPDFNHVMYASNESDGTKEKLLKAQEWVTDSLEEEMSHYYPQNRI